MKPYFNTIKFSTLLLVILCAWLIPGKAAAQSLYEIKFRGQSDTTRYTCMLVYYNEQNAYARISFYNKGNYRVVETRYTGRSGKWNDGRTFFSLSGSDTRYITSKTESESYNPDYFVWIDNAPLPYTTDENDKGNDRDVFKVESYKKLDVRYLTKGYLRSFYGSNERDYLAFLQLSADKNETRYTVNNDYTEKKTSTGTKLHLIVMANTSIYDIGAGCQVDVTNLNSEFGEIARTLNIGFNPVVISGYNFSKENLLYQIEKLEVSPSDIVIFMYRGHGFRWNNQTSNYPSLALTRSHTTPLTQQNTILLETVYSQIKAKGGRLNLVMADCCNNEVGQSQNQLTNNNYMAMQSNVGSKLEKLKALFMERSGSLIVSASEKGQVSWTNNITGGLFTTSFLQALAEETSYLTSGEVSWGNIVTNTRRYAINKSSNIPGLTVQHAISYNQITKK